mmetsp:Transcript_7354/g.16916  ORF Transcript_7354/g.16916 Transcript_7354/m.16916 type:complete len:218 (+) Transcript_7354:221-874(+)
MGDGTNPANVVTGTDHHEISGLELDVIQNLPRLEVQTHRVVGLDIWIRIAEGAAIMGRRIRHALRATSDPLHTAKLVCSLLLGDLVEDEPALGVVEKSEVLLCLLNLHHVHEAGRVEHVRPHLAVYLDEPLHHDHLHLSVRQRILQALTQHHDKGHALPQLVRTGVGLGGPTTPQLVEHPVLRRIHALQVLDDTASHDGKTYSSTGVTGNGWILSFP